MQTLDARKPVAKVTAWYRWFRFQFDWTRVFLTSLIALAQLKTRSGTSFHRKGGKPRSSLSIWVHGGEGVGNGRPDPSLDQTSWGSSFDE